jgi:hypothetical protein
VEAVENLVNFQDCRGVLWARRIKMGNALVGVLLGTLRPLTEVVQLGLHNISVDVLRDGCDEAIKLTVCCPFGLRRIVGDDLLNESLT